MLMRTSVLLAFLLLTAACSSGGPESGGDTPGPGDVGEIDSVKEVVQPETVIFIDQKPVDTGVDLRVDQGAEVPLLPCDPGEGCFGDQCTENVDCLSGWCAEHMGEKVCTEICQEDCPEGWVCTPIAATLPDVISVCVSNYPNLCRPCAGADDCEGVTGSEDACVSYGAGENFCWGGLCCGGGGG